MFITGSSADIKVTVFKTVSMRLGDIKAEALKLMFINYDKKIDAEDIPDLLADDNYASYLVNMDGAIQRGLTG